MSFVVTVPEAVAAAAGDLAAIGSTLREATAAAAGPTTGLAAAAADDVSIAVSQLFGRYGQEFQTVSNQLAAFHTEFVRTLNRGAAAYLNTESANGGQLFGQIEAGQRAVSAAAAAAPGGAYGQLVANTATNLESLYGAWSANPFPFLRQIIANQQVYWQQIAAALANAVQNFPPWWRICQRPSTRPSSNSWPSTRRTTSNRLLARRSASPSYSPRRSVRGHQRHCRVAQPCGGASASVSTASGG